MLPNHRTYRIATAIAIMGMLTPPNIVSAADSSTPAAPISEPPPVVADVTLDTDGILTGRVIDSRGEGVAGEAVVIVNQDKAVSQVTTDGAGNFRAQGLHGGVYRLITDRGIRICRVWNPGTAPPSAQSSVLVIDRQAVTAGQISPLKCWLADPLVIGGIAAIAIAVPVAVHNGRQDRDSGS